MDLLPKKEVERLKADERRMEIDEGVKLAKKVDDLRDLRAKEEAGLKRFRIESIRAIQEEVTAWTERRDTARKEAEEAEERKRVALVPLDAEKARIKSDKEELARSKEGLRVIAESINRDRVEISHDKREIEIEKERILDKDRRASDLLIGAKRDREDASLALAHARVIERSTIADEEYRKKLLDQREGDIAARERDVANARESIVRHETDLGRRERLLQDRQQLLEQTIKRLGITL